MAFACFFVLFVSFLLHHGLASTHSSKGYDYGQHMNLHISKRDFAQSSIVASLPLVDDKPQPRLEIRDLQKNHDQWNLYLLALSWMQYTAQDSPFSWYQIAGRLMTL